MITILTVLLIQGIGSRTHGELVWELTPMKDLIPGFGILIVKLWTLLQGRETSTTTGFVRHLTFFRRL